MLYWREYVTGRKKGRETRPETQKVGWVGGKKKRWEFGEVRHGWILNETWESFWVWRLHCGFRLEFELDRKHSSTSTGDTQIQNTTIPTVDTTPERSKTRSISLVALKTQWRPKAIADFRLKNWLLPKGRSYPIEDGERD